MRESCNTPVKRSQATKRARFNFLARPNQYIVPGMFKDCRLARMSDGHYCLLRNLGPVKGGNGMKHHEVVIDFSRRGMVNLLKRLLGRKDALGARSKDRAHR